MSEINLLPTNVKVDKQTQKSVTLLTRVAVAFGFIVMLEAIIGGILLFILNSNVQNSRTKYDETLAAVKQLEATELNLVLVKDKLAKIQPVFSTRAAYISLDQYDQIVNSLPPSSTFKALEISGEASELTLVSTDSDSLSSIIRSLEDPDKYQVAILDELNFDKVQGFVLTITTN